MGAIIRLLITGLRVGGPAALGYFFNDAASWIARVTGTTDKVVKDDGSGWKPGYVVAVFIALGVGLTFVMKMFAGRRKLFMLALALSVFVIDHTVFAGVHSGYTSAGLLFSIAGSVTDTKSIGYLPQFLVFNIGTVPTSFKIEVAGDGVVYSIDGTGLTNLNGIRQVGALPANQYIYEVANGFINKNTSFTIANASASQLDVYGWSEGEGNGYVMHNMAKAFANAAIEVDDFFYAAFPSAAATDTFTVTWSNNKTETMKRIELESRLAYKQQVAATRYNVDNIQRQVRKIQFNGAADQSIYYTRFNAARGTVRQTL